MLLIEDVVRLGTMDSRKEKKFNMAIKIAQTKQQHSSHLCYCFAQYVPNSVTMQVSAMTVNKCYSAYSSYSRLTHISVDILQDIKILT